MPVGKGYRAFYCLSHCCLGARWLAKGKLRYRESVTEGLENAPDAFMGLLRGENFGKQIVKIADEAG